MPDEEALLHRPRGRQRRWTLRYRPGNPEADAQIGRLAVMFISIFYTNCFQINLRLFFQYLG